MIYSHSNLSLWRLCKRRWYYRYILGEKEPATKEMAYSSWLVHTPIEAAVQGFSDIVDVSYESLYANFLAEWNGPADFSDKLLTLSTAKRIVQLYKQSPVEGNVLYVEQEAIHTLPDGSQYKSIPDFVVQRENRSFTVDVKFNTSNWPKPDRPWDIDPLKPFDDQCLGQAIVHNADGFIRVTFQGDRKSGNVIGPIIEEKLVDEALKREWIAEQMHDIQDIYGYSLDSYYPKNDRSCKAFGRPCYKRRDCDNGFVWKEEERSCPKCGSTDTVYEGDSIERCGRCS